MRGLSLVAVSGGHSSPRCAGLSLSRPLLLRSTGSRRAGSVVVAHGPSCSAACGIFPDQGSNPCPLHWQADSQPLRHQGSPLYQLSFCAKPHPARLVGNSTSAIFHFPPQHTRPLLDSAKVLGLHIAARQWAEQERSGMGRGRWWAARAGQGTVLPPFEVSPAPRALPGSPSSAGTGAPIFAHRTHSPQPPLPVMENFFGVWEEPPPSLIKFL